MQEFTTLIETTRETIRVQKIQNLQIKVTATKTTKVSSTTTKVSSIRGLWSRRCYSGTTVETKMTTKRQTSILTIPSQITAWTVPPSAPIHTHSWQPSEFGVMHGSIPVSSMLYKCCFWSWYSSSNVASKSSNESKTDLDIPFQVSLFTTFGQGLAILVSVAVSEDIFISVTGLSDLWILRTRQWSNVLGMQETEVNTTIWLVRIALPMAMQ